MQPAKTGSVFNIAVIVAALGYFVDIYDLVVVYYCAGAKSPRPGRKHAGWKSCTGFQRQDH